MSGTDATESENTEGASPRSILVKYVGGPKDGEVSRCEVEDKLPMYSMVLATQGQPYLIRRKLMASIYKFDRWVNDAPGEPLAELKYVKSEDHKTAHETVESHEQESVQIPQADV